MNDGMKILVTGSAGFIGNRVATMLTEHGHKVVGIDSMNDAYDISLKHHRVDDQMELDSLIFFPGDIENQDFLENLFSEHSFDAVINCAARAGVRYSMENPDVYVQTNIQGTLNLLEAMRKFKVKKMILSSTSSLYAGHPIPFSEDMPVNEPISPYAATKKAAEALAHTYHHLYQIDISILRYFTVYGPAGRPDMCILRFVKWIDQEIPLDILGDGLQRRDFTYVDDIVLGTISALKPVGYEIINLGGGNEPVSLIEVIEKLEGMLGKKAILKHIPENPADMRETSAVVTKAKELLDWEAQTSLDDGLQACVDWYFENKEWAQHLEV